MYVAYLHGISLRPESAEIIPIKFQGACFQSKIVRGIQIWVQNNQLVSWCPQSPLPYYISIFFPERLI